MGLREPAPPASAALLRQDPRLQREVSLSLRFTTLQDTLDGVAAAANVRLIAAPELASENVTVFVTSKPAWEVLDVLGSTLGYRWSRETDATGSDRYRLSQDERARRNEADARANY